jgi:hypothetical protein
MTTGHCNSSFSNPDTLANLYPHHILTHSHSFSHPSLTPTQALRRRLVSAGLYPSIPGAGFPSTPMMHSTHLPTPGLTSPHVYPPPFLHGAHELAHTNFSRRRSEPDVVSAQALISSYATPNHRPAPAACQQQSTFSLAPSGLSPGFTKSARGLSPGTEGGNFPDQSPTPSGSQEDCWMSDYGTPSPELDATGVPSGSQTADYPAPHTGISLGSPCSPSSRLPVNRDNLKNTRAAKGLKNPKHASTTKRHKVPMDPKAAKRLGSQRQTDDENIRVLWDLFVPKNEEVGLKKDRLAMSMSRPLELSISG